MTPYVVCASAVPLVDVRAERLQRQTALQVPLFAGDFRAVQAAGDANLDAFAAKTQSGVNGFAHGAAEGDALFKLQRDRTSATSVASSSGRCTS